MGAVGNNDGLGESHCVRISRASVDVVCLAVTELCVEPVPAKKEGGDGK